MAWLGLEEGPGAGRGRASPLWTLPRAPLLAPDGVMLLLQVMNEDCPRN